MKTYFRLLSFAKPIEKFAIPYIVTTLLAVVFNTLNLALIVPVLTFLFNTTGNATVYTKPESAWNMMANFNYYSQVINKTYGTYGALQFICVAIIISVLLSNLFKYISQRIMENLRIHTLLNIRKTVFENVMNMHLGFFNNERKGDILSKITNDVQVVQFTVTGTLQVIFREPFQLIAYLFTLFAISYKLTFISILFIPISAIFIARLVKSLKNVASNSQSSFGVMVSNLEEALTGVKIIKAFNAGDFIKQKFNNENENFSEMGRQMAKKQQLASPISEFLGVLMVVFIVLYGGSIVLGGDPNFTAPMFIGYIGIFSQLTRPAKALSDSFTGINLGLAAGERILELIDMKPAIQDAKGAIEVTEFNRAITINNINFSYGEKIILTNVSLTIPIGKTIALVGPSGGGKSTLMDLIPRFIEPQSGSICFDDTDIKNISMDSLRSQIGFVNQESILFNDTIFNNIAFGKPDSTKEAVEAAARIANAHDFILNTDNGYETNIGDRGIKLSGGQKQRINIARAVLKNPPIMLLDEATSALDTESEKSVQDALNKLMKNRTTLVIAHRLSTIKDADLIVVLDSGKIVETGTHSELMVHDGVYRRLVEMQTFSE
ncbi:ABC transporter ATP-binding protein [Arcticibacter eurypsychrophilus]|uniref:ABC transporter ATP-binding protein n=1 Tax=Arcticibacter eurypsychrophilus TaxID=1434752 RepID=UPI00084DF160|nr:ABC transporter ATP-binding protein [Arcticibacter eurypsychrophilus]